MMRTEHWVHLIWRIGACREARAIRMIVDRTHLDLVFQFGPRDSNPKPADSKMTLTIIRR
jgi:hypothetical protein